MATPTRDTDNNQQEPPQYASAPPKDPHQRLARGTVFLSWRAPEYVTYKKTPLWYLGFGIMFSLLLLIAILILKSFPAVVVFALLAVLFFTYSERKPRMVEYDIRSSGIRIGDRVYLYRDLLAFNVIERGHGVYLIIQSRRTLMPLLHVPLGETDPEEVQTVLIDFLDEEPELTEPIADVLAHWLGF